MDIVTLVGPRKTGKSTIGPKIATELGWKYIDMDEYMNEHEFKSYGGIFKFAQKYGWDKYMELLHRNLKILMNKIKNEKVVLDLGGGAISSEFPESKKNAELVKNTKIMLVLPDEDEEKGLQRLFKRERKLAHWNDWSDKKLMEKVRKDYFERVPGLRKCAHEIIHVGEESPEAVAKRAIKLILK